MTGFVDLEASMAGNGWNCSRMIAPDVKQVCFLFNPDTAPGGGSYYVPTFEARLNYSK